jgi:HEPN domain-containing protein
MTKNGTQSFRARKQQHASHVESTPLFDQLVHDQKVLQAGRQPSGKTLRFDQQSLQTVSELAVKQNQKRFHQSGSSNDTGYESGSSSSLGGNSSSLPSSGNEAGIPLPPGLEMEEPMKFQEPMKIQVSTFLAQASAQSPVAPSQQEPDELQQASEKLCMAMKQLESAKESAKLENAAQQLQMALKQCLQNAGGETQPQQPASAEQAAQAAAQQLQMALKQCLQTAGGVPQPQQALPDALARNLAAMSLPQGYPSQDNAAPNNLDAAHCIASSVAQQVAAAWQNVQQGVLERQTDLMLQQAVYSQFIQAGFPGSMPANLQSQMLPSPLSAFHGNDPLQHLMGTGRSAAFPGSRPLEQQSPEAWQQDLLRQPSYPQALPQAGLGVPAKLALQTNTGNPYGNYQEPVEPPSPAPIRLSGDRHSAFSKSGGGGGGQGGKHQKQSRSQAAAFAAAAETPAAAPAEARRSQGNARGAAPPASAADSSNGSANGSARGASTGGRWMQYLKASPQNNTTMRHNLQDLENIDHSRIVLVRKINRLGIESPDFLEAHYSQYGKVDQVLAPHSHVKLRGGSGWRLRPTCLGFVVMSKPSEAEAILAAGPEQQIRGGLPGQEDSWVTISVSPFQKRQSEEVEEEQQQESQQ